MVPSGVFAASADEVEAVLVLWALNGLFLILDLPLAHVESPCYSTCISWGWFKWFVVSSKEMRCTPSSGTCRFNVIILFYMFKANYQISFDYVSRYRSNITRSWAQTPVKPWTFQAYKQLLKLLLTAVIKANLISITAVHVYDSFHTQLLSIIILVKKNITKDLFDRQQIPGWKRAYQPWKSLAVFW